ncbi:MAG TPA: hypothetical protein VFZ58_05060 [Candidatus Saccharimonadales bacterium]
MAKEKLELEQSFNNLVLEQLGGRNAQFINPRTKPNFSKTKDGKIGDVLKQRHNQREVLFYFALWFVAITTTCVFGLIICQAYSNTVYPNRRIVLVNDTTLHIIVAGIFVQFVGLVGIITKSIWNDKPYLEAGVMGRTAKEHNAGSGLSSINHLK